MTTPLPLVQQFLDYLVDERHFSPYTARCYGLDLRQYGEFLAEEYDANATPDAEAAALAARTASITGGFVALALACRYLKDEGVITRDPIL